MDFSVFVSEFAPPIALLLVLVWAGVTLSREMKPEIEEIKKRWADLSKKKTVSPPALPPVASEVKPVVEEKKGGIVNGG